MSLELTINEAIKTAMREKDRVALDSLRAVKAQILLLKTEAIGAEVSAEQEIAILQRMIKQRKDSYDQFTAQGRTDLAEVEEAQSKVIEKFLPQQLSAEELINETKQYIKIKKDDSPSAAAFLSNSFNIRCQSISPNEIRIFE